MTLKDYYDGMEETSPKVKFRDQIIQECGISVDTFYKWMNGSTNNIPKLAKQKISEIALIPVDDLFPVPVTAEE